MNVPALYRKYFVDKRDERSELFQLMRDNFTITSGIYPGSFTHITPSFYIPEMVYVDMDKRCKKFFDDEETIHFINDKKIYNEEATVRFHQQDFSDTIDEKENEFDLMLSLYSGFISRYCKKYLRKDGFLLVNNSHGDATLAFCDDAYELIGVVKRNGQQFSLSSKDLQSYFETKSGKPIDKEKVEKTMRGPAYRKPVYGYIFQKG
jgi:hypothetical protein